MSVVAAPAAVAGRAPSLARGLRVQARVVGALVMRELHTRYGRDNIGYLWMIVEPALLAVSVSALHFGRSSHGQGVDVVGMSLCGYCAFMIFRGVILRAESTLEANRPLLFHRSVTILDMLVARTALEAASTLATLTLLWTGAWAMNLIPAPHDLLLMLGALMILVWLSFALSLLACAAVHVSRAAAKIIHPVMYMMLPASGAFFLLDWLPGPIRRCLVWSPLVQIFELLHAGQFEAAKGEAFNPAYVLGWCLGTTFLGLVSLKMVRRGVHLG